MKHRDKLFAPAEQLLQEIHVEKVDKYQRRHSGQTLNEEQRHAKRRREF